MKTRADTREARLTRLKKITLASVAERNRSSSWTKRSCQARQGGNTRRRKHAVLLSFFFFFFFFYIFFFLPVWLVAADGRSIRCLVNFQADSLDWLAELEKKLNGSVKRKTTKYFKIDYFCVKNIPLKKRRRRRVILLVWSANGTDLSRRMFLLFVVLVQIYVRVSYDSFLKEPASLIPQET